LRMTIVCPRTVIELIGPTVINETILYSKASLTVSIFELEPVDPVLLSWRRKVCEVADNRPRWRAWRERGD
jgi:hypothetical protein